MKILDQFLKFISRSRIWKWWTLSNWKEAVDVGMKLAAILGVLAATNFFVLKPEISWEETYRHIIEKEEVYAAYGGESNIPSVLINIIDLFNSARPAYSGSGPDQIKDLYELAGWDDYFLSLPEDISRELRRFYMLESDVWNIDWPYSIPQYARDIAHSGQLDTGQLEFALQAIESSRYVIVRLAVKNSGPVVAKDVKVVPPGNLPGQYVVEFDIPAERTVSVELKGDYGDIWDPTGSALNLRLYDNWRSVETPFFAVTSLLSGPTGLIGISFDDGYFYVYSESSDVIDVKTLTQISIIFFIVWIATIVKDIYWPPSKGENIIDKGILSRDRIRILRNARRRRTKL